MKTARILYTQGDPLESVRRFLIAIWGVAGLEGMLVPVYQMDGTQVAPILVKTPERLAQADPFAPRMPVNAARLAIRISQEHPSATFCAVLRSCEARAFRRLVELDKLSSTRWLVIGVDCLASFPEVDFAWRVRKAHQVEALTQEALRFSRQGGIAPYRYRDACQMCQEPSVSQVDLCIGLIGLPVKQYVIISASNPNLAAQLRLEALTDGDAPDAYLSKRDSVLASIAARRQRMLNTKVQSLAEDAPRDLSALLAHIATCTPCQACLEACPFYFGNFIPAQDCGARAVEAARIWLESCVECGMCDEACPNHLPLTTILNQIAHPELVVRAAGAIREHAYAGGHHASTPTN